MGPLEFMLLLPLLGGIAAWLILRRRSSAQKALPGSAVGGRFTGADSRPELGPSDDPGV